MISNFNEFYFVEKAVTEIWIWMWFVHRVWSTDKFSNLRWPKVKAMELKSTITILLLIAFPIMAIYDISWIKIKYSEGHIGLTSTSADGHTEDKYIEKPYLDPNNSSQIIWSKENQTLKKSADYLLCVIYSLQTGTLILLQAFWSHLTDQMADKTFMNSSEFKLYILWSLLSILIFPIPRYMLDDNQLLSDIVPTLIFSIVLLLIFSLAIRTRVKLKELLKKFHRKSLESQETSLRINYFLEMNCLLMIGLLLTSIGFICLFIKETAIAPPTNAQMITINAIFRDFLTVLTNFGNLILWVTIIFIIYPRYHITGLFGSLSLTKKTLNRLSKVIVVVNNDQSSMTTSDDSEYYEEEDVASVENDKNKGAQRFSGNITEIINDYNYNYNDNDNDNTINSLIEEQDKIIQKFKNSNKLFITPPPPSLQPPITIHSPNQLPPYQLSPSLNLPPPPSSKPPRSLLRNNNISPSTSSVIFPYKDKSISLLERNDTQPLNTLQNNSHNYQY